MEQKNNINELEELSIKEAKKRLSELNELNKLFNQKTTTADNDDFQIGKNFYVATVTHHYVGKLLSVSDKEIILTNASWVADDGRFHKFMKGEIDSSVEFEPFPADKNVFVGRGALIVACEWEGTLPTDAR